MGKSNYSETYININGVNIYCEYILNGKPPIVLIHGYLSSTYTFNKIIPLLENHFSIIAMDLPGFGKSEKSLSFFYSYHNYAQVVAACIDYFNLDGVTLVGHSMGGQIALYTARIIPEKVKKLILVCSSGYLKGANRLMRYCSYLPLFHQAVQRRIKRSSVKESLKNVFYDISLMTEDHIREFTRPLKEKNFSRSLIRLLRHREGDLTSEQLKEIDIPTLLLWGEEDKVVPVSVGHRLVNDLPKAELITYEKTGHLLTEEIPSAIFENILSYHRSEMGV
ncbi:alpha/beta hydrolase [Oceanobacillus piezotolerans]|uniref:Alpha/beta hydrolase n=1 Tax=Oceanobacillus piezotolerans TaxID=2448030 RepID=A0A498DD72_9BACI|nr:alpha/beta hydrolase [Oceanobacillus piezotolerans]RLL40391.1 alpha/beta hydrolase [Oceanobacillus piezotolerans]